MTDMNVREQAVYYTKTTGVLPAIKLRNAQDLLPYARAMVEGGIRVLEVTMTTPGVLDAFRAITAELGDQLYLASGTTLDAQAAYAAIMAGAKRAPEAATRKPSNARAFRSRARSACDRALP